jgi:IS1 family transposase
MVAVDLSGVACPARQCTVFHAMGAQTIQRRPAFLPVLTSYKLLEIERLSDVYKGVIPAEQHRAITKKARKTNHIERFNNTLRQRVSRLVRETLSFSKTLANHIGAIKYFICHYNLTRRGALPV